jgi:hypothetical protein
LIPFQALYAPLFPPFPFRALEIKLKIIFPLKSKANCPLFLMLAPEIQEVFFKPEKTI